MKRWLLVFLFALGVTAGFPGQQKTEPEKPKAVMVWTHTVLARASTQDVYETTLAESVCRVRVVQQTNSIWLEVFPMGHSGPWNPAQKDDQYNKAISEDQILILDDKINTKGRLGLPSRRFAQVCGEATKGLPTAVREKLMVYLEPHVKKT